MTAHISPVKTCIFDKETWFGTAQYGFWKTALKEVNKGGWLDQFHSSHLICQAEIQGYMVSVSSYQPKKKSQPCGNQCKFCPWTWWDQAPGHIFKGILNQVCCIVWIVKQEFNFLKKNMQGFQIHFHSNSKHNWDCSIWGEKKKKWLSK